MLIFPFKIKKIKWKSFGLFFLVFVIMVAWIFFGWPQIRNNPPIPPEVKEARASPAEYLSNPSFTGGTTDWTLSVTTYDSTTYQDTAGSIETNPGVGRNNEDTGTCTQTIGTSIDSTDTVNLSLYWKKSWIAVASVKQNLEVQIKKPSMADWSAPVTIWSETTIYQDSGWVSAGPTDVSSYFDETGTYEIRFWMNPRNGNNASAETHIWVDNTSLDVTPSGTLTVDIVDGSGNPVASPSMAMGAVAFSFTYQTANGTFGVSAEKIRVDNSTANPAWTLTIAANGGSTAFWNGAASDYDFNDPTANAGDGADADSLGGQMTLDPSVGTITPKSGCTNTGLTLGSSASFDEGVTDSVTLITASASAETSCYWDLTGVDVSQTIPAEQGVDNYSINMTLTVTAS